MNKSEIIAATSTPLPSSPRALLKAIFDSNSPEQVARSLPAQVMYLLVREAGVTSSLDLLALADYEQFRLMLDFDLWRGDELNEETFWEWLSLVEEADDFSLLQKVLKTIDLKLVGMMLGTYVETIIYDEGNDQPPHPGFYTPDKGYTWMHITIQEPNKHFLLARFLALIFETSAELFYQLLSVPTVSTRSQLEEESYQDRVKRLEAQGVPNVEFAHQLLSALPVAELQTLLSETGLVYQAPEIRPVPVLHHTTRSIEPLDSVFRAGLSGVEEEFTLLANAAIVKYNVDFSDRDAVQNLSQQMLGAINIGLQRLLENKRDNQGSANPVEDSIELVKHVGLTPFLRCGLTLLDSLHRQAQAIEPNTIKALDPASADFLLIAGSRERIPVWPEALLKDGSLVSEDGKVESGFRAIVSRDELALVKARLESVSSTTAPKG